MKLKSLFTTLALATLLINPSIAKNPATIKFTKKGVGNVNLGEKYNPSKLKRDSDILEGCFSANTNKLPEISFMIIDNHVVRIDSEASYIPGENNTKELQRFSHILSPNGVKIGDSLATVYKKHPNQKPKILNNPYGDAGKDIALFYGYRLGKQSYAIRYDIMDKTVIGMGIGDSWSIELMEGCA